MRWTVLSAWVWVVATVGFPADEEPVAERASLPRAPATEPADALGGFTIRPGFRIELVAAEPLVADPVAMAFDENGRLFVIEMRGYSERRGDRLGRVRLLEDRDGDGRFEYSTVYAKRLAWPTAIACFDGGVFVGATPDIYFLKDTDGDNAADVKRTVFTGFGEGVPRTNMQSLMNSFRWSLDNRIHCSGSGTPGKVRSPEKTDPIVSFRRADFSFDPRMLDFRLESGGAQHGLDFDPAGCKFVCSNSHHIQQVMYEWRYAGINPGYNPPQPLLDIPEDGPAATVFRRSPDEPWRVIRTRWRMKGLVRGPIEGGGRPSGYFTAATGVTIYDGHTWPEEFWGDAFTADCGSNLVHRKKLRANGVAFRAERPADEQESEFLASTDNWFRPVQMEVGPDGALYIADMYREVIEHPWSLPDGIKRHLDLNSGNDRGRIYRIVPEDFRQPPSPRLDNSTTAELVALLGHSNGWHRATALRLLFERQSPDAIPLLRQSVRFATTALGRMHSLYALRGMGSLQSGSLIQALWDATPVVRRHAVRLSEGFLPKASPGLAGALTSVPTDSPLAEALRRLASETDAEVRYQLAWTLAVVRIPGKARVLEQLLKQSLNDRWLRVATLNAVTENHAELLKRLSADSEFLARPEGGKLLKQLKAMEGHIGLSDAQADASGSRPQVFRPPASQAVAERSQVVQKYHATLGKTGNPKAGQVHFQQRCIACHELGGEGNAIGPDLKSARANGPEKLLTSILDPNREVAPQYVVYTIERSEGEPVAGMIANENAAALTLLLPDGSSQILRRSKVLSVTSLGLSLMPEGLEAGLSVQDMSDLLAWVLTAP